MTAMNRLYPDISPLNRSIRQFFKHYQWGLSFTLLSLHSLLVWGVNDKLDTAFTLLHYGCFLVWQPILKNEQTLSLKTTIALISGCIALVFFLNWWLLAFWLCLLFALLGGRIFSTSAKSARLGYMLAAGYVLAVTLLWVIPELIHEQANLPAMQYLVMYGLPLLPLAILFTKTGEPEPDQPLVLDFFYTLMLLMFAITLVLGSYAIATSSKAMYPEVLIKLLFALAASLLAISWLWNPRAGFSGLENLLSRYLLSVGLPFENWVKGIAELADRETSSKGFVAKAMQEVAALPWVQGLEWSAIDSTGEVGGKTEHVQMFEFHDARITMYTTWPLTPALTLHVKLLTQILGEFYEAKRREETLAQNAYMQAIYETGSRLTHDIKNLVQSMGALCSAAEKSEEEDNERLLALLKRQLPLLNQRMARTLEKLQAPKQEKKHFSSLATWWSEFQLHYTDARIRFHAPTLLPEMEVETDVLDSVIDNLIQNALSKARNEPGILIEVQLSSANGFTIEVADSGKPMPEEVASSLFKKQVSSENGLGVGLFHAGKQAGQSGLQLSLAENREGQVRFRLTPQLRLS